MNQHRNCSCMGCRMAQGDANERFVAELHRVYDRSPDRPSDLDSAWDRAMDHVVAAVVVAGAIAVVVLLYVERGL